MSGPPCRSIAPMSINRRQTDAASSRWRRRASPRASRAACWLGRSPERPGWGRRSTTTTSTPEAWRFARNVAGSTVRSPGSIAVADQPRGPTAVAVETHRAQVSAGAEGRVDPLVAEHGDARSGRLLVQHRDHGAEQRLAMHGRRRVGGLRAVPDRGRARRRRARRRSRRGRAVGRCPAPATAAASAAPRRAPAPRGRAARRARTPGGRRPPGRRRPPGPGRVPPRRRGIPARPTRGWARARRSACCPSARSPSGTSWRCRPSRARTASRTRMVLAMASAPPAK